MHIISLAYAWRGPCSFTVNSCAKSVGLGQALRAHSVKLGRRRRVVDEKSVLDELFGQP